VRVVEQGRELAVTVRDSNQLKGSFVLFNPKMLQSYPI